MDQRSDQLNEPGWIEDPRANLPEEDNAVAVSAAETDDHPGDEAERIKADIEDTRAEMGQTINEIQERLSPEHIMDQVKETVREATIGKVEKVMDKVSEKISNVAEPALNAMGRAGETLKETGSSLTNTVRQNPIPFALIGLGVGMFIVNRVRNADGGTIRSRAYETDYESGITGTNYAGMGRQHDASKRNPLRYAKNSAANVAQDAAEKMSEFGQEAKERALWAGRSFQRLIEENPLAAGAAAVAVGAAVGLALPVTRVEHEYMGEASEKLVDRAQLVAREAIDKVKTAAQGEVGGQGAQAQAQPPGGQPKPSPSKPGQSKPGQPRANA